MPEQEWCEKMQGALLRGGYPAAETNPRGTASCFRQEPPPAPCPTPDLHAAAGGQQLHSLSQSGPGQPSSMSAHCTTLKNNNGNSLQLHICLADVAAFGEGGPPIGF